MKFIKSKDLHQFKELHEQDPDGRGRTVTLYGFYEDFSSPVLKFNRISNTYIYDERGKKTKFDGNHLNVCIAVFTTERDAWKDFSTKLHEKKEAFMEYQRTAMEAIERTETSIADQIVHTPEFFV